RTLIYGFELSLIAHIRRVIERRCDEMYEDHFKTDDRLPCFEDVENMKTTSRLRHFRTCPRVNPKDRVLLGDRSSEKLTEEGVQLPSLYSLDALYQLTSNLMHTVYICTEFYESMVPTFLPPDA